MKRQRQPQGAFPDDSPLHPAAGWNVHFLATDQKWLLCDGQESKVATWSGLAYFTVPQVVLVGHGNCVVDDLHDAETRCQRSMSGRRVGGCREHGPFGCGCWMVEELSRHTFCLLEELELVTDLLPPVVLTDTSLTAVSHILEGSRHCAAFCFAAINTNSVSVMFLLSSKLICLSPTRRVVGPFECKGGLHCAQKLVHTVWEQQGGTLLWTPYLRVATACQSCHEPLRTAATRCQRCSRSFCTRCFGGPCRVCGGLMCECCLVLFPAQEDGALVCESCYQ